MKKLIFIALVAVASTGYAAGTINAAVMKFKIYKIAFSTSTTCSSPITALTSIDGVEQNMVGGATFGSANVAAGTYPCVMIEMSKIIKTRAATTTGNCNSATEFSDVICQDGSQMSKTIDGVDVTCSGGSTNDQRVTLYITTLSAGTNGTRALLPPLSASDTTSGLALSASFVVADRTNRAGNLAVIATNFLNSNASPASCTTSAPGFTFN